MEKKYYLNRINNDWATQYALLDQGYVSIGWLQHSSEDVLTAARNETSKEFERLMEELNENARSRWNMWYFAKYKKGDIILVPLFDKNFSLYEVIGDAKPVSCLSEMKPFNDMNGKLIEPTEKGLCRNGEPVDIGFVTKVKAIKTNIPRSYAEPSLISRMKIRTALADISDLNKEIEAVKERQSAFNFSDTIVDKLSVKLAESFDETTPDGFEELVKWYMTKKGADIVYIPGKNEAGKYDYADADVVAAFEDLKTVYYIQAKWHKGKTDEWGVEQIAKYKEQMQVQNDDYTYIAWVITSANFDQVAAENASEKNIRLINGVEFARMLINVGLYGIADVKNAK